MIRRLAAAALILLLVPAEAALTLDQPVAVGASTIAPPVTLAALHANTIIGASATSATTSPSAIGLPLAGAASTLSIVHGPVAKDVSLRITSRSGFAAADSVTVALGAASTTVTATNSIPRSTTVVDLGTVSDLTVTAAGVCLGSPVGTPCTLTIDIRIDHDGASTNPLIVYPYTLIVT